MNKNVIFDLDGTLLDSMDFWDGVGREFLARYGVVDLPSDFNERVKAMSVAQASEYFRDGFGLDVTAEFVSESMYEMVANKYRYKAEFKEGVRETLETLRAHGANMCIATATYGDLVVDALTRLDALHYFDFILSCGDVGKGKDDPLIFYTAMERLGGNKADTVIVEDSLHAISTAKGAGFKVIAVHDKHQQQNLDKILSLVDKYTPTLDADSILTI